jgi:hypothetical protein
MLPFVAAARDRDIARRGVDAVLDKLSHGFQGVLLGKGDDGNGIPIIANSQPARILHAAMILSIRAMGAAIFVGLVIVATGARLLE